MLSTFISSHLDLLQIVTLMKQDRVLGPLERLFLPEFIRSLRSCSHPTDMLEQCMMDNLEPDMVTACKSDWSDAPTPDLSRPKACEGGCQLQICVHLLSNISSTLTTKSHLLQGSISSTLKTKLHLFQRSINSKLTTELHL